MTTKVTRDFFKETAKVVLRPESKEQAILVQKILAKMGIKWAGGQRVGTYANECAKNGMQVEKGKLYYFKEPVSPQQSTLPINEFLERVDAYSFMTEQQKLRHDFNQLSAKVDRILELLEGRPIPTIPAKPRMAGIP